MEQRPASAGPEAIEGERHAGIASGQRLVIYAILLNLATLVLEATVGSVTGLLYIPALVVALVGFHRLASGLRFAVWKEVLLIVALIVPLLNLIVLVAVNARATSALRAAGYRVGLLGASRPASSA